eukprot:scaffold21514_cov202-Isochrysis_galbana.AAC.1
MENNSIKIQQLSPHPKGLPPPLQTHHSPTNRDQQSNNRFADQPSTCRFCHEYVESSVHLGRCPSLKKIFGTINKALGYVPRQNRSIQPRTNIRHAFLVPPQGHPP